MREIDLTKQQINPIDEVLMDKDKDGWYLNFLFETWFDVDAYFGTNTKENDDVWVNFYVNWYDKTDDLKAFYEVNSDNGTIPYMQTTWDLTEEEKKFLRPKMEKYIGSSFKDYCMTDDDYKIENQ